MGELEAALQQLMQLFAGSPAVAGPPSPGGAPGAGQPGGAGTAGLLSNGNWLQQILNLVQAGGGASYGSSELNALQQIYAMQRQAANMALGIHPGNLGVQAARMATPLNKQLAYQVTSAADQNSALNGMAQAPGAVASGEAAALAPYVQQNLQTGANLATDANQLALSRLSPSFMLQSPDYLSILKQLGDLGQSQTFSAPSGTPGAP
jgi:hypothetical protein